MPEETTGSAPEGTAPLDTQNEANTATKKNPFGYFKPAEDMLPVIQEVRDAYSTLHEVLLGLPGSRENSVAITTLETSAMWAIKGLVLHDAGSTQPEQSA